MAGERTAVAARPEPGSAARARVPAAAIPAAIFVLAAVLLALRGLRFHGFLPDEYVYLSQARAVAGDLGAVFDEALFHLGVERLHELLQAGAIALFEPATALAIGKVIPAVAFASATVPAWLLARGCGAGRAAAAAAASLAVAVPWVTLATTYLNEPVAYPVFAWAAWAIWRAAVRPGLGADALALALVALAALSRSSLVVMAAALPLVVLVQELRFPGRDAGLRALPGRLWRRHGLLVAGVAVAAAWVLLGGHDTVRGYYSVSLVPDPGDTLDRAEFMVVTVATGLALVPPAIALAWIVRTLVRPGDARAHALAVTTVVSALLVVYTMVAAGAVHEERYVFYVAPLVSVGFVLGVSRRELPPALVAAAAVALAAVVAGADLLARGDAFDFLAFPGEAIYLRQLAGKLGSEALVLAGAGVAAVGLACALRRGGGVARAAAAAALAGFVAFGAVSAAYTHTEWVDGVGDPDGPGFGELAFLDDALGRDPFASYLDGDISPTVPDLWTRLAFFNASLDPDWYRGYAAYRQGVSAETGRIDVTAAGVALPLLVVTVRQYRPLGLAGRLVAAGPALGHRVEVYELPDPPQARWWVMRGPGDDQGTLPAGIPARIRVFGAGLDPAARHCWAVRLVSPWGDADVRLRTARERRTVAVAAGATRVATVEMPGVAERGYVDVAIEAAAPIQLGAMAVRPCAAV